MDIRMKTSEAKMTCRREGLRRRAAMTQTQREMAGNRIAGILSAAGEYKEAERLLVYAAFRDEVPTGGLIRRALQDGKKVFCPRVENAAAGKMCFLRIRDTAELHPGYRGIPEPAGPGGERYEEAAHSNSCCDLILLPGAAFDRMGHRLGYGAGFYDRYLENRPWLVRAALCFSCQLLEMAVQEETDIAVQLLVTEQGLIRTGAQ